LRASRWSHGDRIFGRGRDSRRPPRSWWRLAILASHSSQHVPHWHRIISFEAGVNSSKHPLRGVVPLARQVREPLSALLAEQPQIVGLRRRRTQACLALAGGIAFGAMPNTGTPRPPAIPAFPPRPVMRRTSPATGSRSGSSHSFSSPWYSSHQTLRLFITLMRRGPPHFAGGHSIAGGAPTRSLVGTPPLPVLPFPHPSASGGPRAVLALHHTSRYSYRIGDGVGSPVGEAKHIKGATVRPHATVLCASWVLSRCGGYTPGIPWSNLSLCGWISRRSTPPRTSRTSTAPSLERRVCSPPSSSWGGSTPPAGA
jgi:hypothetical protein